MVRAKRAAKRKAKWGKSKPSKRLIARRIQAQDKFIEYVLMTPAKPFSILTFSRAGSLGLGWNYIEQMKPGDKGERGGNNVE